MQQHLPKHDCSNFVKKVFLVLDGEITDDEKKLFIADIERCKYCLEHYRIEKQFKDFIASKVERKNCSTELKQNIMSHIKQIQSSDDQ